MKTASNVAETNQTVNPETLQFNRAVKDYKQAFSICKRIEGDNRKRNLNQAAIMKRWNDEQPWDPGKLKAAGQDWRNNRSTGFFSSLIKRATPPYTQMIDSARVLTNACFEQADGVDSVQDQKVEDFRVEITKTIRRWDGWHNAKQQTVLEDVMFGYATWAWTDEDEWKPRFSRSDEALYADGCPQEAVLVPLWLLKQKFMIHELADKLKEPEISEAAGWFVPNIVKSINAAIPENRRASTQNDLRKYEDTIREASMGRSYTQGVKVIEAFHLFVQEATGFVSHFLLDARSGDALLIHLDRFASMDDCLALFSVEVGNGKLHGSKGAGRVLYNTAVAADQARNIMADNLFLSGLLILKGTTKGKKAAAIQVVHPTCIIGDDYEVVQANFTVDKDAFFELDRHLTSTGETLVGAFMPSQNLNSPGDKPTASQVNYVASVEQQIREGILMRFWGQLMKGIYQMQKRICSMDNIQQAQIIFQKETASGVRYIKLQLAEFMKRIGQAVAGVIVDESKLVNTDAVKTCLALLRKGLSASEIYELGQCPPNEVTQDFASQNPQVIGGLAAKYKGDPNIRQNVLIKKDLASQVGNTVAEQLLIPEEDNTLQAEATRLQLIENGYLFSGETMPVSPRDVDVIHMGVLQQKCGQMIQTLTPNSVTPQTLQIAQIVLAHFDAHLQSAAQKGMKPESLKQESMFSLQAHKLIDGVQAAVANGPQSKLNLPPGASPASAVMNQAANVRMPELSDDRMAEAARAAAEGPGAPAPNSPIVPGSIPHSDVDLAFSKGPKNLTPKV